MKRLALAFVLLVAATPALAQDWPTKTVRFVVPFGAGSTPDIIARLVSDKLQAEARAEFHRREQGGRERHDWHRCGREGRTRRPHHRHQPRRRARDQHAPVLQDALRSREGDRADHHSDQPAERARRPGRIWRHQRRATRRPAEKGAWQVQFRLDRQRLAVASRGRGDRAEERHQADARPVRLLAAGDDRACARRCADWP